MAGARSKSVEAVRLFLGKCMPCVKQKTARIRISQMGLDQNLLMYFSEFQFVFAYDPEKKCKTGDTVLIKSLAQRRTKLITHEVINVIYPLGDVTDPITGKKVVLNRFREDIKAETELYADSTEAFDYDKEPPRGITEGIRDFSHKMGTVKYHEDPDKPVPHAL